MATKILSLDLKVYSCRIRKNTIILNQEQKILFEFTGQMKEDKANTFLKGIKEIYQTNKYQTNFWEHSIVVNIKEVK